MGITLNVWIFSGLIGVAYIMGYLMSRTMGRVLAVEGADPEATRGETAAWPERTQGEGWMKSERAARQEATEMPQRTAKREAAVMSQRAAGQEAEMPQGTAWREAAVMPPKAARREAAMMPQRAARREAAAMSQGTARREAAMMPQRAARQEAAVMPQGMAWPEEAVWEEEAAESGMPSRQEPWMKAGRARRAAGQPVREPDRDNYVGETREWQKARVQRRYRGRSHREQQAKPAGHPIASPVAGQVDVLEGRGRRGVLFTPEDNRVYAPASGKIIRLYPRGNEFLLRTDSGVVLRLRAGERDAEMTRDYFRPRIMQNEFVGKGKLLLEYDREALARDGYDTHVSMTVEEEERSYDLSVTGSMWVKNGQDCLWVL